MWKQYYLYNVIWWSVLTFVELFLAGSGETWTKRLNGEIIAFLFSATGMAFYILYKGES